MKMKICFHNSVINFRSLSKINARDKPQLIFVRRSKSLIVYSLESHVVLPEMKIITLENLSVIDKIQSHSSDSDFGNIKIKSMIKM